MTAIDPGIWPRPLRASDFPAGTPLNAFFAWNEARWRRDRRYTIARDISYLYRRFKADEACLAVCVCHIAIRPVIRWRFRSQILLSSAGLAQAMGMRRGCRDTPVVVSARRLVGSLLASIGAAELEKHAAVFKAFEEFSELVDLDALAALRPRLVARPRSSKKRNILVIKLSALGDFVQSLGPAAAIRQHHAADEITLLTTRAFAALAQQSGFFDKIVIDARPKLLEVAGWVALRRVLRSGRFDRVYDLQTSDRSSLYSWLFPPARSLEWSGIAWHCSHPHANLARHPQHTIDKQAEQLLMAGIHPTPLPCCRASTRPLPAGLKHRDFFILIPGSSPRHTAKRWPARCYGELAQQLFQSTGIVPVIIGGVGEEASLRRNPRGLPRCDRSRRPHRTYKPGRSCRCGCFHNRERHRRHPYRGSRRPPGFRSFFRCLRSGPMRATRAAGSRADQSLPGRSSGRPGIYYCWPAV